MAGRWSNLHRSFIEQQECDVWLLTEVPLAFSLERGTLARSAAMAAHKSWSGVWCSQDAEELDVIHPVAVLAGTGDYAFCSCVLPWRGARASWPEVGTPTELTRKTVETIVARLRLERRQVIWGGDWNHSLRGPERAGSHLGRAQVRLALNRLKLQSPTEHLPHAKAGLFSIDHVAVPLEWRVSERHRLVASIDGKRLSDHDAYVVIASPP